MHKYLFARMLILALFVTVKMWKQFVYLKIGNELI